MAPPVCLSWLALPPSLADRVPGPAIAGNAPLTTVVASSQTHASPYSFPRSRTVNINTAQHNTTVHNPSARIAPPPPPFSLRQLIKAKSPAPIPSAQFSYLSLFAFFTFFNFPFCFLFLRLFYSDPSTPTLDLSPSCCTSSVPAYQEQLFLQGTYLGSDVSRPKTPTGNRCRLSSPPPRHSSRTALPNHGPC